MFNGDAWSFIKGGWGLTLERGVDKDVKIVMGAIMIVTEAVIKIMDM